MKSKLFGLALMGLAMGVSLPAMAGGPGVYTVKGNNGEPDSDYTGTLTIVQTSKGSSGTALLIEDDENKGGYKSIWAFKGETQLGIELITPKK